MSATVNSEPVSRNPQVTAPLPGTRSTRLYGWRVPAAWVSLWAVVAATLTVFVVSIPARFEELHNLNEPTLQALNQLGVSPEFYAWTEIAFEVGIVLAYGAIASIIFWQRSHDWLGIFVSLALFTYAVYITPTADAVFATDTIWRDVTRFVQAVGISCALIFFYIFPDGRFVPRWTSLLAVLCVASAIGPAFIELATFNPFDPFTLPLFWFVVLVGWFSTCLLAQIYRFIFFSDPIQRQQSKMVVFSTSIAIVTWMATAIPRHALILLGRPTDVVALYELVATRVFLLTVIPIPIAFAFSILRYRLWDIDALINRTIVYGALTAILGGLYSASIGVSQRLFVAFTGNASDGAIVFTTLVVAAAFTPVKNWLQRIVDKYFKQVRDPSVVLNAFRQRVRSVVQVIDTRALMQNTLDEAMRAYGAVSGALYRELNGERMLVCASEGWNEKGQISVPVESPDYRFGILTLGPRENGQAYSTTDQEALQNVLTSVARAVERVESHGATTSQNAAE